MPTRHFEPTGRIAIFRDGESTRGTPTTSNGVMMDFDEGSGINLTRNIQTNADTIRGAEFITDTYFGSQQAAGKLSQKRAHPDFLIWLLAHFFGSCSSSLVGGAASYKHVISPMVSPDQPTFTLIQRKGDGVRALKERWGGNHIDSFEITLGEGWVTASATIKGRGFRENNIMRDALTIAADSTTATLTEAVAGTNAAERVEAVMEIRGKDDGASIWEYPSVTTVSTADPAVITFDPAIGTTTADINAEVVYIKSAASWETFPAAIAESPLKINDAQITLDGYYNGTAVSGGKVITPAKFSGFSIKGVNNIDIKMAPDGTGLRNASDSKRTGRAITIEIPLELRDQILQASADNATPDNIAVRLNIAGAEIEDGVGFYFGAELIFPMCRLTANPISADGKILKETATLEVCDDGTYSGVVIKGYNSVAAYVL